MITNETFRQADPVLMERLIAMDEHERRQLFLDEQELQEGSKQPAAPDRLTTPEWVCVVVVLGLTVGAVAVGSLL